MPNHLGPILACIICGDLIRKKYIRDHYDKHVHEGKTRSSQGSKKGSQESDSRS